MTSLQTEIELLLLFYISQDQLDCLIERAADLPQEEQAELARSILERLYHVEDEERA
jgi:hypothetical protein